MSDRDQLITDFLQASRWANWTQTPIAGDASARRYLRLMQGDESVIVMDADPQTGQDTAPFATIGAWLRGHNLCAPETLYHDPNQGIMVISDLGRTDFAQHLVTQPQDAATLYQAAVDVLITLDTAAPPASLPIMTPRIGGDMVAITTQWYTDRDGTALTGEVTAHLHQLCGPPDTIALRDFHAENLIWRPEQTGVDRVGLLDYQDAFVAPRGYDLVSLLRDVRRDVDPDLAAQITHYFTDATGAQNASAAFACLAVQRNLRILGVFARLALQDGKTRYIQWMPRIWSMIINDLSHPALATLKSCVLDTLPAPQNANIRDLL